MAPAGCGCIHIPRCFCNAVYESSPSASERWSWLALMSSGPGQDPNRYATGPGVRRIQSDCQHSWSLGLDFFRCFVLRVQPGFTCRALTQPLDLSQMTPLIHDHMKWCSASSELDVLLADSSASACSGGQSRCVASWQSPQFLTGDRLLLAPSTLFACLSFSAA